MASPSPPPLVASPPLPTCSLSPIYDEQLRCPSPHNGHQIVVKGEFATVSCGPECVLEAHRRASPVMTPQSRARTPLPAVPEDTALQLSEEIRSPEPQVQVSVELLRLPSSPTAEQVEKAAKKVLLPSTEKKTQQ